MPGPGSLLGPLPWVLPQKVMDAQGLPRPWGRALPPPRRASVSLSAKQRSLFNPASALGGGATAPTSQTGTLRAGDESLSPWAAPLGLCLEVRGFSLWSQAATKGTQRGGRC